jgi:beta-glucanase (GH16 family)
MMTHRGKLRFVFLPSYGCIEASINYNDPPGMWSAFWDQPPWIGQIISDVSDSGAEIDICERRTTDGASDISGQVQSNVRSGRSGIVWNTL